ELGSLRNATTLMTQLKTLRPNDKPPALVMNQVGMPRRQEISTKEVASILKIEPMVSIPHDPRVFSRAASQGKMVAELGRKKPIAQAFSSIANTLVPQATPGAPTAPKTRSLLKR
ncbi:MAG: CtpF protein, partial [Planctomycetota bacterium]